MSKHMGVVVYGDLSKSTELEQEEVKKILDVVGRFTDSANTAQSKGGDDFLLTFSEPVTAINCALTIRDKICYFDWQAIGVKRPPLFRIAVAMNLFKQVNNPIDQCSTIQSEAFIEAARMEPVVEPGEVWCDEATASLVKESNIGFRSIGLIQLPKQYGQFNVYAACWEEEIEAFNNGLIPPLKDEQYFRRRDSFQRFSLLWLLLDQLPRGGWGRSTSRWMNNVWEGIPDLKPDENMKEEGGFETTILNFEILHKIFGNNVFSGNPTNTITECMLRTEEFLKERQTNRGAFGTKNLGRQGDLITGHVRHTALAAWLYAKVLYERTLKNVNSKQSFKKAVNYLLLSNTETTIEMFTNDRNPLLLYLLTWQILETIRKTDLATLFNKHEQEKIKDVWNSINSSEILCKLLPDSYNGCPENIPPLNKSKKRFLSNGVLPYGNFVRMESYTLLTCALLINEEMPSDILAKISSSIADLIKRYLDRFGKPIQRWTVDLLRPIKQSGVEPFLCNPSSVPDLGITAMLIRVLRDNKICKALFKDTSLSTEDDLDKLRYFLQDDLIKLFDRYIVEPQLFRLTHPGMLAASIVGHDPSIVKSLMENDNWQSELNSLLSELNRFQKSHKDWIDRTKLMNILDKLIARFMDKNDNELRPIQLASHSLATLLLDCQPCFSTEDRIQLQSSPIELTSMAYNCSVDQFHKVHTRNQERRQNTINEVLTKLEKHLESINIKQGECYRILDLGCGFGDYVLEMRKKGWSAYGVDLSENMILKAREKYEKFKISETNPSAIFDEEACEVFKIANICDLPTKWKNNFHGAICITAFQHIPLENNQAPKLLRQINELLVSNGIFRFDVQLGRGNGYDPDLRFIQSYDDKTNMEAQLGFVTAGFNAEPIYLKSWKLPKEQNTFRRPMVFKFLEVWLKKAVKT